MCVIQALVVVLPPIVLAYDTPTMRSSTGSGLLLTLLTTTRLGVTPRHTPILNDNATKQNQYIEPRRDDFLAAFFTGFLATFLAAFDFLPYINEPSCHQQEPESATTQPS
jgi:hypothetical protein